MSRLKVIIFVIVILAMSTCISFASTVTQQASADALYELGLFKGTGVNADGTPIYSLEKTPTRAQAVTMLVRLLGKEQEALSENLDTPFTDVEDWAKPYVGYAYNNGLTNGTSATTFAGNNPISENQYLTFILRAIGYDDSKGDFIWNNAKVLTSEIGITEGLYENKYFTRGDVANISFSALSAPLKNDNKCLFEKLIEDHVFTAEAYDNSLKEFEISSKVAVDQSSDERIPIGFSDVNNALIALNPSRVYQVCKDRSWWVTYPDSAATKKPTSELINESGSWWVLFPDVNMYDKVLNAMDNSSIGPSRIDSEAKSAMGYGIVIEINRDGSGYSYWVNKYSSNGTVITVYYHG